MGCITVCKCTTSMQNTGTACSPLMGVTRKDLLQPTFKSDGTENVIDLTDTIDEDLFTDAINNVDSSLRIYPLPSFKNLSDSRGDSITESFSDGTSSFIQQGPRNVEYFIVGKDATPKLAGKINAGRCTDMSVWKVDKNGSLIGIVDETKQEIRAIKIDSDTLEAVFIPATDTTTQKIRVRYTIHPDEQDSCMGMITADELGGNYLLNKKGLLDTNLAIIGTPTTTVIVAEIYTDYGTALNPVRVKGLVVTDFISTVGGATSKVRNVTDGADVALTSVVEGTGDDAGIYTITMASAQTSGDVIAIGVLKAGYDFTNVASDTVTIP